MGNSPSDCGFHPEFDLSKICVPLKIKPEKGKESSCPKSSSGNKFLIEYPDQRGYSRVVHGNGGTAFVSAMHGI